MLNNALSATDVDFLNRWLDDREEEHVATGGDASAGPAAERNPVGPIGPYSANVLLRNDGEQLDRFIQNPNLMPFVDKKGKATFRLKCFALPTPPSWILGFSWEAPLPKSPPPIKENRQR